MSERESIFDDLADIIGDVDDVAFVSRDFRKAMVGSVDEFPAVFLVDLGDTVDEAESVPNRNNRRILKLGVVSVLEGSTEDSAPGELATFQESVKGALYQNLISKGHCDSFQETGLTHLSYPAIGPKVVQQGIEFEIRYIEDLTELVNP